jgi:hypothetical protein
MISESKYGYSYSMEQRPFEKLTGFQPVKKFPSFYGIQKFIIAFKCAWYLSLS